MGTSSNLLTGGGVASPSPSALSWGGTKLHLPCPAQSLEVLGSPCPRSWSLGGPASPGGLGTCSSACRAGWFGRGRGGGPGAAGQPGSCLRGSRSELEWGWEPNGWLGADPEGTWRPLLPSAGRWTARALEGGVLVSTPSLPTPQGPQEGPWLWRAQILSELCQSSVGWVLHGACIVAK